MDFTNFDESQKFPPPLQIEENLESPKMLHFFVKTANLKGRTWLKNFPPLKFWQILAVLMKAKDFLLLLG